MNTQTNDALTVTGTICSILGLIAVFVLQTLEFGDRTLLFWWITTAVIAIAATTTYFSRSSDVIRIVFVIVFVAQIPAFDWAWGQRHERDTTFSISVGESDDKQREIDQLERENSKLSRERFDSMLFWQSIAHLSGMMFALGGCILPSREQTSGLENGG